MYAVIECSRLLPHLTIHIEILPLSGQKVLVRSQIENCWESSLHWRLPEFNAIPFRVDHPSEYAEFRFLDAFVYLAALKL